jgi:hypothetical protein
MNKPKVLGSLETVQEEPQATPSSTGKDVATSAAGAGVASLLQNVIEKGFGVHNSDIMKTIEELQKNQNLINPNEQKMLLLLREIRNLLLEQKSEDKSWMLNIR